MLLTATIPVPGDSRIIIEMAGIHSGIMARMAAHCPRVEFSKPGKNLIRKPGGARQELFDKNWKLTPEGLHSMQECFQGKVACACLFEKYEQLKFHHISL